MSHSRSTTARKLRGSGWDGDLEELRLTRVR